MMLVRVYSTFYDTFYSTFYTTFCCTFQPILTRKTATMALVHQRVPVTCSIWANCCETQYMKSLVALTATVEVANVHQAF